MITHPCWLFCSWESSVWSVTQPVSFLSPLHPRNPILNLPNSEPLFQNTIPTMSLTWLSIFPVFLFFPTRFSPDSLAGPLRPSLMWPLIICLPCYLLYQSQIKLCPPHPPNTHTLPRYIPVPMSSWCVLCPERSFLPSLIHLLNSSPAFRTFPSHQRRLSHLHPSSTQAGWSAFPRALTLPQTCLFPSTCHTLVMCLPSCQATAFACVSAVAGWEWHAVNLWMDGWIGLWVEHILKLAIAMSLFLVSQEPCHTKRRKYNFPHTVRSHPS